MVKTCASPATGGGEGVVAMKSTVETCKCATLMPCAHTHEATCKERGNIPPDITCIDPCPTTRHCHCVCEL